MRTPNRLASRDPRDDGGRVGRRYTFQRRTGLRAARASSRRRTGVVCGALFTSSGRSSHSRPVKRLDEVRAAKQPVVRYAFEQHRPEQGAGDRQLEAQKGA